MKLQHHSDGTVDVRRDDGRPLVLVRQIQVEGSWWWAAIKPNRETVSPEGRPSREAALRDALDFAAQLSPAGGLTRAG